MERKLRRVRVGLDLLISNISNVPCACILYVFDPGVGPRHGSL